MKQKDIETKVAIEWFVTNQETFKLLGKEVKEIIEYELEEKRIFYNSIESRAKSLESYSEKCKKEKYKNPKVEIMDMIGIRITAYTNADVSKISNIIEETFDIDSKNSTDKLSEKKENEFGYLSVHYVARLKPHYLKINKYKKYRSYVFEIQIRTILQHAWSEIEHDRNYKFKGTLPKELRRRFYMIAGVLEMVDREFESLTYDIEKYEQEVNTSVEKGNLNIELTDVSISEFMKKSYPDTKFDFDIDSDLFEELTNYGLKTVKDLKVLIESIDGHNLKKVLMTDSGEVQITGILRDIMIINDKKLYFKVWNNHWDVDEEEIEYFREFGVDLTEYKCD